MLRILMHNNKQTVQKTLIEKIDKRFLKQIHFENEEKTSDPGGIRTPDPQLRRLLLYPAELPDHHFFSGAKVYKKIRIGKKNGVFCTQIAVIKQNGKKTSRVRDSRLIVLFRRTFSA